MKIYIKTEPIPDEDAIELVLFLESILSGIMLRYDDIPCVMRVERTEWPASAETEFQAENWTKSTDKASVQWIREFNIGSERI